MHLADPDDFIKAFLTFRAKIDGKFTDEQNYIRLFDIWLANLKDEKVLDAQLKKEPWEEPDDDSY